MQISTHTISGIELFDVKRINRATIADGDLLSAYVYEPLIQNEDILASAVGSAYNAIDYINHTLQDKKDKQDVISLSGSATKTVKKITQNENGEMTVEFQDIDLPPEVPNVELISTDDSISISATSVGNDVTYDLSVKDIAGDANYALLSVSGYPLTANHFGGVVFDKYTTKGITWSTVDNRLEIPNTIELIDVNVECELLLSNINNVTYDNLELGIYQSWGLLEEKKFEIDLSKARHFVTFTTKMLDVENLQFTIKSPANGTANIRVSVNDETVKLIAGGGGTEYTAGSNINITDNVISGRDWTPELNTKLDSSAFVLPNSANWDNTYNTVLANSAAWNEGATYSAGPNINITDNVISGRDWTPELNTKLDTTHWEMFTQKKCNKTLLTPGIDENISWAPTVNPEEFTVLGNITSVMTSLVINLSAPPDSLYCYEYNFRFTTPAVLGITTFSILDHNSTAVSWIGNTPSLRGGKTYEVSVVEGIAVIGASV